MGPTIPTGSARICVTAPFPFWGAVYNTCCSDENCGRSVVERSGSRQSEPGYCFRARVLQILYLLLSIIAVWWSDFFNWQRTALLLSGSPCTRLYYHRGVVVGCIFRTGWKVNFIPLCIKTSTDERTAIEVRMWVLCVWCVKICWTKEALFRRSTFIQHRWGFPMQFIDVDFTRSLSVLLEDLLRFCDRAS